MDKNAHSRLDKALQRANPNELRKLNPKYFAKGMAELYTQLDYVHPFTEGNSRTLRVFTQQLARASGYEIDWNHPNTSDRSRDFLYIARDREVGEIGFAAIRNDSNLRLSVFCVDKYAKNPGLQNILETSIRPMRAVAFEVLPEKDALQKHSELGAAYNLLHRAEAYYAEKSPDKRDASVQNVKQHIQSQLNKGETRNFRLERQETEKTPVITQAKSQEPPKTLAAPTTKAKPKAAPEPDIERWAPRITLVFQQISSKKLPVPKFGAIILNEALFFE
ncbi:hypothetical protein AGMMS50289_26780 [Betaproteobacteria bacterium]|nr:hypothetical protein AGMMS50289_26780 [Betaproteobacteria bacterium]